MKSKSDIKKMIEQGTLCAYPFRTFELGPHGRYRFCCKWDQLGMNKQGSNQYVSVSNGKIQEGWNHPELNAIRRDMLEGKKVSGCWQCYNEEKSSDASLRQQESHWWADQYPEDFASAINEFETTGRIDKPWQMDLRLSTLCNLMCRMCTPDISTNLAKETGKIIKVNSDFSTVTTYEPEYEKEIDFGLNKKFMEDLQNNMQGVRKLFFLGGEPSVMRSIPILLQYCIDKDIAKNIEVQFSTNLTNPANKCIEKLSHFKSVQLTFSIDGFEKVNDYIRYPSKWDVVKKNLKTMLKLPKPFHFVTSPVPQVYNILNWYELMEFWQTVNVWNDVLVAPCHLEDPGFLKINNLPEALRPMAIDRLEKCFKLDICRNDQIIKEKIKFMITELEKKPMGKTYQSRLQLYTHSVDSHRDMNIKDYIPDLANGLL